MYKCLCCQDNMDYNEGSLFIQHSCLRIGIYICSKCNNLIKLNRRNNEVLNNFIWSAYIINGRIGEIKATIEKIADTVAYDGIGDLVKLFKSEYSDLKSCDVEIEKNAEKINNMLEDVLFNLTLIGLKKTYYRNFKITRSEAINMLGIKSQTITKYNKRFGISGRIKSKIYDREDIDSLLKMNN